MQYKHFSVEEREKIQRFLWKKRSIRWVAERLKRSPSSVAREISRNNPVQPSRYTPRRAHDRALKKRKNRGRTRRLKNEAIRVYVVEHLKMRWSPEQISGRMKKDRIGYWEGDTVESKDPKPGINTVLERKTGIVMITKLGGKRSADTVHALADRFAHIPRHLRHTVTLDRGSENSDPHSIEAMTGMQVFHAHAYSAWERGANENVNGLIRDYFPKKTDFTLVPDAEIAVVEYALNTRPRKRLGWRTPLEVWSVALEG